MRRIAIINQKGGVGKTTTTANLGVALSRCGHRVLVIDLDPQSHLSLHLGIDPEDGCKTAYDLLCRRDTIDCVRQTLSDRLWMVPSHRDLFQAEAELVSVIGRETILSDALHNHGGQYDFVLIDCPPSLGILSLNALCAVEEVIIPMQAHFLALQGVGKLLETIHLVQSRINPKLSVSGVLLCMFDAMTRLSGEVMQDLKTFFDENRDQPSPWSGARVFDTVIRRNIKLAESPSHGLSVLDYAPKSHGALDYQTLAVELLGGAQSGGMLRAHASSAELTATPSDDDDSDNCQPLVHTA